MSDPSKNFGEAAERYRAFRPAYPQDVYDFLLHHLKSGQTRAVDLGAGSGQATQTLAAYFDKVIAVEPDARLAGTARLPPNVELEIKTAEAADFDEASIDAVISATAFHWMDQALICANVAQWLKPGGVFFPFAFDAFEMEGEAGAFYRGEFEKWKAFRDRRLVECYNYERALKDSGAFGTVIPYRMTLRHRLPPEQAAGLISTFSFARDHARATGDAEGYFRFVKDAFLRAGDAVTFTVPVIGALGVRS